jgi:5-methyltetrahydrofolate--homocysteine methyltransferase
MNETIKPVFENVLAGNAGAVKSGVEAALAAGMDPAAILNEGLIAAMSEVGRRFEEGEYFVPEMLIAARAMKEGLALLKPRLLEADVQPAGKVVLGTVRGDLHDIGKNLVGMMLEGAGFEVVDLGTDVTAEKFISAAQAGKADLIGLSALLTTTMPNMKATIHALKSAGLAGKVKVMVGGAPVTETYAREIGADGYAPDASRAAALARSLLAG